MLCEWRTGDAGPSAGDAEGRQAWEGGQDFLLCCWGGGKTSKVVIVGSYSLCSCADSDWPDWDQGSAMPHASLRSAERGSLPDPAAAGTHQLCLSIKVALQEWRLRGKLLSWSTIFPKSSVQEPRFILLEPYGVRDLPKEAPQHTVASTSTTWACVINLWGREFIFSERQWLVSFSYIWIHIWLQDLYTVLSTEALILT